MDSTGGESWMRKQDEEAAGKISEMQRDAEEPMGLPCVVVKLKMKEEHAKDSNGSVSWMRKEAREDTGKRSEMQRDAEEPTGTLRKAKKAKATKKKTGKRKGHAEDSIGSHQIGEMCYEGATLQDARKLYREYRVRQDKLERKTKKKNQNKKGAGEAEPTPPVPDYLYSKMPPERREKHNQAGKAQVSEMKNPSDRGQESVKVGSTKSVAMDQEVISPETEESVTEAVKKKAEEELGKRPEMHETAPVPAYYSGMRPEYRGKLMKHNQERAAAMDALLASHKKRTESRRSGNPAGGGKPEEAENELGKILEMTRISPESQQLDAEIHKALLDIQQKLTKKKTKKTDRETLRLLKDMSNKLDMLDQGGDDDEIDGRGKLAIDETCLDTNGDRGNSPLVPKKTVAEEMAQEAESFASHRRLWEYKWSKTCGNFTAATLLSSMQFTHYMPGRRPYSSDCSTTKTLQIISIQLTGLAGGLEFPLSVYGVVAVRDMVDRNRNVLFFRNSYEAQEIKQNDPFLHLIGPSRAIVFVDKVCIEIELRVKGGAHSQGEAFIRRARRYSGGNPGVSTICFKNALCTIELCLQPVEEAVQATILGVQVAKDDGSWPFKYGGLVACTPRSGTEVTGGRMTCKIDPSSTQIVLIESKDEAMPEGRSGYVHLWRQVVSVKLEGRLDFVIKAYSKSGDTAEETSVCFNPNLCNISQKRCALGDAEVAITVAWSRVASSKTGASLELHGTLVI